MAATNRAGGAAMSGGQRFQVQVTASWAARILLQTPVGQRFDLSALATAQRIYAETTDSVDDIRVEFSDHGILYGQCKKRLSLSTSPEKEWASVLGQFCKELKRTTSAEAQRRFVLFYEAHNGNLEKLDAVLNRYRRLPTGTALLDAATNAAERALVNDLSELLPSLQASRELNEVSDRTEELLRSTYIEQLKLRPGDSDYLAVVDALQNGILTVPMQVIQTTTSLHRLADDLLADRGSVDRIALRQRLKGEGIALKDSVDCRSDFERLDTWSSTEIASHEAEKRSKLIVGDHEVSIIRPVVDAMTEAAQKGSFVVVGGAGSGKTGCLLTLANRLRASGFRVWYWAADSLPHHSPQEIGAHLQLQHSWAALLAEAASGVGAILLIDGLDGLRDTRAQRAYLRLLALAIEAGIAVVASIRSFDLLHSVELQELFGSVPGSRPSPFSDSSFAHLNHIVVSELTEAEVSQVIGQLPTVETVLNNAPKLRPVVRNLFSLDLLCKLLASGDSATQLSEISTQADLFERYWAKRIVSHPFHDEMEHALRQVTKKMVSEQNLQIIPDPLPGPVRDALFSAEILRHPPTIPGRLPRQELVEFNHHLLFDYAAELLFIRSRRSNLAAELTQQDSWGLFLRPSLVLFFRYMWLHGRLDFWDTSIELERHSVPLLHRMPGHLVVAEEACTREELQATLEHALRNNDDKANWVQLIRGLSAAATFSSLPKLFNRGSGDWWIEYARDLIHTGNSPLVYAGQRILFSVADDLERLSTQGRRLMNDGAIQLIRFHWGETVFPSDRVRPAIGWVCRTISADTVASSAIIREIISLEGLQRAGYIQAHEVARHIKDIWRSDASLAVEVYDAFFGYIEEDKTSTQMGESQIMPLRSHRSQDYGMAYYLLAESFPAFLSEHPQEATRAIIRVIDHWQEHRYSTDQSISLELFIWNDRVCHVGADNGSGWRFGQHSEEPDKMLQAWREYLSALPADGNADTKWEAIAEVLSKENVSALIWAKLLEAGRHSNEFYAERLCTILLNPTILVGSAINNEAVSCVEAFASYLPDEAINQIQSVILSLAAAHLPALGLETAERRLAYIRARLLSCIPEERRGDATKTFLDQCDPEMLQQHRRRSGATYSSWSDNEADWVAEEGGGVKSPLHQEILQATAFLNTLSANEIRDADVANLLEKIRAGERMLAESKDQLNERVSSTVQEYLFRALSRLACADVTLDEGFKNELFEQFRGVLELSVETPDNERLAQFDHHLSWGTNRRYSAAEGFICLAVKEEPLEPDHQQILKQLAADPDPVVRLFMAHMIWPLLKKWPEFVWITLERWVADLDTSLGSLGVLQGGLRNHWFWWLRNEDAVRADQLLKDLLAAARRRGANDLRGACGNWIAALWFFKSEGWAQASLDSFLTSLRDNIDEANGALNLAINLLLPRTPKDTSHEQKERALGFLVGLLRTGNEVIETSRDEIEGLATSEAAEDPSLWARKIFGFFHRTAIEFQFSAEGYSKQWATDTEAATTQLPEWWATVEPILDAIVGLPHPAVVYHLIEGIEHLVTFDVQRCLHWLRKVTLASVPQGLNVESLAADTTIKILENILAGHKFALAAGDEMRLDFVQTLEAYLQIGWPKAMRLAIQLESIFR